MQVSHSRAFTGVWVEMACESFGGSARDPGAGMPIKTLPPGDAGGPTLIRVDADALTYPLHIVLHFRLGQGLVDGSLGAAALPDVWDESMERLLGVRTPNPSLGCLQDTRWYGGNFGYFPSYGLGVPAAAQLFQDCKATVSGMHEALGQGDASPVVAWLRQNVHEAGCLHSSDGLLEAATGSPLDARAFERHIRGRCFVTLLPFRFERRDTEGRFDRVPLIRHSSLHSG